MTRTTSKTLQHPFPPSIKVGSTCALPKLSVPADPFGSSVGTVDATGRSDQSWHVTSPQLSRNEEFDARVSNWGLTGDAKATTWGRVRIKAVQCHIGGQVTAGTRWFCIPFVYSVRILNI